MKLHYLIQTSLLSCNQGALSKTLKAKYYYSTIAVIFIAASPLQVLQMVSTVLLPY